MKLTNECKAIMKVLVNAILLLTINMLGSAQVLKTYNGNYQGIFADENGKAIFTYYDDNATGERVRQGLFKFTLVQNDNQLGSFTKTISGSYNKNLKNGPWIYSLTYKDFDRDEMSDDGNQSYHYNATGTIMLK